KFRMALLPASGFQSAQYRLIEIGSTDLINLVTINSRDTLKDSNIQTVLDNIYWKSGATELASGKKTLTLQQFEEKYMEEFYETGVKFIHRNLRQIYLTHFSNSPNKDKIIARLRQYDLVANVHWRLVHLKSSGHYLTRNPDN